jgi:protein phosphatase
VTALAIRWQGAGTPAVAADPSVVSTQMVPEGEVASRIDPATASGSAPGADDPFDEDDIEKAIAEIRDAIEKSSQVLKPTNN